MSFRLLTLAIVLLFIAGGMVNNLEAMQKSTLLLTSTVGVVLFAFVVALKFHFSKETEPTMNDTEYTRQDWR